MHTSLSTLLCTQCTECKLLTVQCTLCPAYFTLYTTHYTLHSTHCSLLTIHCTVHTAQYTLHSTDCTHNSTRRHQVIFQSFASFLPHSKNRSRAFLLYTPGPLDIREINCLWRRSICALMYQAGTGMIGMICVYFNLILLILKCPLVINLTARQTWLFALLELLSNDNFLLA